MFKSIRSRVALANVIVWAVILIGTSAGTYLYLLDRLYAQLDANLETTLSVVRTDLIHEVIEHYPGPDGEDDFRGVLFAMHQHSFPQQAITVSEGARIVLQQTGDSEVVIPPAIAALGEGTRTIDLAGLESRIASRIVSVPGVGASYTVAVAQPLRSVSLALASLRTALLILIPVALLLAAAGGYWHARRSLAPVAGMARAAEQIHSRDLARTIPIDNPDDELGLLARTFNGLLQRLRVAFDEQERFMADASHELRTPVSVSMITVQVALEQPRSGQEYREALGTVQTQMERLARLVQDMMTLVRSDAGSSTLRRQPCRLDELLEDVVASGRVLASARNVSIEAKDFPPAPVDADPQLIRRMFINLIENAINHSPAGSVVQVRLSAGAEYQADVIDQGSGVPQAARDRIFDRFYRAETSRARNNGSGSGLGLAICLSIARQHGGNVELAATGTTGSIFRVHLPLSS